MKISYKLDMKMRVTGPAFCAGFFVFIFSSALADDYKRKDYLESYERTYERSSKHLRAPILNPETPKQSADTDSSFDEYSLYDWTEKKNANNPESATGKTGWLEALYELTENLTETTARNSAVELEVVDKIEANEQARKIRRQGQLFEEETQEREREMQKQNRLLDQQERRIESLEKTAREAERKMRGY